MSWGSERLGSLITIKKGKKHTVLNNGLHRYINIEDLHNPNNLVFTDEKGCFVDENDLIIAWDGANAGKVGVGYQGVIGSTLAKLTITNKTVAPRFLFWMLESLNPLIKSQRTGATIPHINGGALKNLQIPLPPLPIQKRIAEILDAADALKRKDQELLKKYDELAQAIFIDMFGDPVMNEKCWEVRTIGSLTTVGSGSTPSRQVDDYFGGDIPWVKTTEVKGDIIFSTEETISEEGLKKSSCKLYPKNSVIIAMYGQGKTRGQVGMLGVEAATNQACAVIRPCEELDSTFLFNYLKLSYKALRGLGRGGNQENLNKGMVEEFSIIFPDYKKQLEFNKKINILDSLKNSSINNISENLFNSLIQKAFNGEMIS